MPFEFPEEEHKKHSIDPESELYKSLYEQGGRQEKDEIDVLISALLTEMPMTSESSDHVDHTYELKGRFNRILKDKNISLQMLRDAEERMDDKYGRIFILGEPYGNENIDFYALDGDDIEDAHALLEKSQRDAVILKGKLGLPHQFSHDSLANALNAISEILKSVEPEKEFSAKVVDDREFFKMFFKMFESVQEKISMDDLMSAANGMLAVSEISLFDQDQLESLMFFLTALRSGVESNEIPRSFEEEISFSSEEERDEVVKRIVDQRDLIKEQLRVSESISFDELFLKDEADIFLKELLENPLIARLQLVEKTLEELIMLLKKVNVYGDAFEPQNEVSITKRKEALLFFYPEIEAMKGRSQAVALGKAEEKFLSGCSILSRIISSVIRDKKKEEGGFGVEE